MNECSLCNPDNLKRRDEAYRLLAQGCTIATVGRKLDIGYYVLQRCWTEHDQDPIRCTRRRLIQAKKRLAKAEAHHKKLKGPDSASRLEVDAASRSLNDLERHLNELERPAEGANNDGAPSIAWLDDLLERTASQHETGAGSRLLGMMNILNRMPDGPGVADFLWELLHNETLLSACMKLRLESKELHPRAVLGERLAS